MEQSDLISVIIPVYNVESYVRQTLDSIINQTYKELEILVIDDGSNDNSGKICDEYLKDDRVKVFHRENKGNDASRQFGVDNSKGKYFVTIDADDYVTNDFIENLYKAIKENNADISVCGVQIFNDGKEDFHTVYMPPTKYEKLIITNDNLNQDLYKFFNELLLSDAWNKMYRLDFVKNSNVKFQLDKIYNGCELKFNNNLILYCPIFSFCNKAMILHRIRKNSRVTKKNKPLQEGFEIITESIINTAKSNNLISNNQISNIYYWLIGNVVMDIMIRGGSIREKHLMFKSLIKRNKLFLKKHKNDINKLKSFKKYKLGDSKIHLLGFTLHLAIWLDNANFIISFLRRIKRK